MQRHITVLLIALFIQGCAWREAPKKTPFEYFQLRPLEKDWGYTQAVKHGKTIYVSGSVSMDANGKLLGEGDMKVQLRNALEDIRKTLAFYHADYRNIVKETIYTTDMDALIAAYDVRADFYRGIPFPSSSWVGVKQLGLKGSLVEVEVVAELE